MNSYRKRKPLLSGRVLRTKSVIFAVIPFPVLHSVIVRCSFFWLLLLLAPVLLRAQTDSLLTVIKQPANDTADINAYFSLMKQAVGKDRPAALEYGRMMVRLAEERDIAHWAALGYRGVGVVYWMMDDRDSAFHYYNLGMDRLGAPENDPRVGTGLLINIGAYHQTNNDLDEAIRCFARAFEIGEQSGYTKDQPKILNNLGALYRRIGRPESARRAYQEAMRLKEATGDSLGMAATLANLGKVRLELGQAEAAEADLERSKQLYLLLGMPEEVSSVDVMKGVAYYKLEQPVLARETILRALDDPRLRLPQKALADALFVVAETYREEQDYEEALRYLRQGKPHAMGTGIKSLEAYYDRALGRVYQGLGRNAESSAFFADFSLTIDTVIARQRLLTQNETAEIYQAKLREAEIERQQLTIAQQRQGQRLLWLGLAGLASLALVTTLFLRSRLKFQRSEARRLEVERVAEVNQLRQEAEVSNLRSMVEGQEAERQRVAKDLHDGLGGLLATVKARLSVTTAVAPEANRLLDRACTEVRRIAHNMMPQTLALAGLSEAVRDIVAQLNLRGLNTELELVGQPDLRLDEEAQAMLLRIIQELSHNVVKHAEADKLFIQLLDQPTQLLLTVEDNGIGFDPNPAQGVATGLGLSSIAARAAYLRGELQYDSSPGHGTTVTLTIPL